MAEDAENCSNSAMGGTWVRGGGREEMDAAGPLFTFIGGGCEGGGAGRGENKYVLALNAACMHLLLHYISLSHISILLLQPLSI